MKKVLINIAWWASIVVEVLGGILLVPGTIIMGIGAGASEYFGEMKNKTR